MTDFVHRSRGARRPRTLTGRVVAQQALAHDVVRLTLQLRRGVKFAYRPGQYVDFLFDDGRRRSFSIANAGARDGRLEFHLRVTPGGRFAHYVRDEMPASTSLRFEGPLGDFYLRERMPNPVLLVAGGTGFAPMKAMLERALPRRRRPPLHLYWGARTRTDLYLDELARSWADRYAGFAYTPVLSEPGPGWTGERGPVHQAVLRAHPRLDAFAVYLAGPPPMVNAGKRDFPAAGLDAARMFHDPFDYAFETWPTKE